MSETATTRVFVSGKNTSATVYHTSRGCAGRQAEPVELSRESAEKIGMSPCPTCTECDA